jgi:hypothetical protein
MKEELILKLVQIQNQFRFLHWQTTDLLNIRDEILTMVNKLKYLLTLKH